MLLRDKGIFYRRVVWRPDDSQWWTCKGDLCWPERGAVKLRSLNTGEEDCRRTHEPGLPDKEYKCERGLSGNYADLPDPAAVLRAARNNLDRFRILGFVIADIRTIEGLTIEHDPIVPGVNCYAADVTPDETHCLIVPDPQSLLLKSKRRNQLINLAYEVDSATGELLRLYSDIRREALKQ